MNSTIAERYNVTFENEILSIKNFPKNISKSISTNNKYLTRFLYDWIDPGEIEETMIPDLNQGQTDSETVGVFVDNGTAKFYDLLKDGVLLNVVPEFSMPLDDLIEIVNGWKDFLRQAPFNGTEI